MGVKNIVKRVGEKAGNKVAKLASLSPDQVMAVQLQRAKYLLEQPNPDDVVAKEITERMMSACSIEIFNAYLPQIKELYLPINKDAEYGEGYFKDGEDEKKLVFNSQYNIRYFNITKWVTDKKENNLEKLINVYAVLSDEDCNIALVFNRTQGKTNVYLAITNLENANNNTNADSYIKRLEDAMYGNFPGAEWKEEGKGIIPCLNNDKPYSVAVASNIPTEKSEKFISQTIEKLLDGIIPESKKEEYTIILLATPIRDVEDRKLKLGEFYSGLKPYAEWQTDFHLSDSDSIGSSATVGLNVGTSAGIQNGVNRAQTETDSETGSNSRTDTKNDSEAVTNNQANTTSNSKSSANAENTSETRTTNTSHQVSVTATESMSASAELFGVGTTISGSLAEGFSNSSSMSLANQIGKTVTDTLTQGVSNTISTAVAKTTGTAVANTLGKSITNAMAKTAGTMQNANLGINFGANFARSSSVTATIGKSQGITQSYTNYNIKHALELLENQMKRFEQSTALGMWDFAAYVLSEESNVANNVAHSYLALTQGEESYMSKSAINMWKGNVEEEKYSAKEIVDYLRELRHPLFAINPYVVNPPQYAGFEYADLLKKETLDQSYKESEEYKKFEKYKKTEEYLRYKEYLAYPSIVTATTSLSGKELAYSLNFPQKAIAGLPIIECAEFGRNIVTYECEDSSKNEIELGNIFHMNHVEENRVCLAKKSLASHTFITGSTGSGKSNTVYQMLKATGKKGVKFLVVEPAKGEYKNVFGMQKDVSVYGTNPKLARLLRINPFSFPKDIHVLEHLDRLVELFNVCWPMYAAMPAVLKNAVEKSYVDCGWDLILSENKYGENIYPSFKDVAYNVKSIIDTSEYDADNKGAYKGALLTRLESLTNGLNGMIFVQDEIDAGQLFDENVIVDLSRVGSSETKSLIMGMLVLKLQEHRMTSCNGMNLELNHLTVLEEAHNILRRTSTEQSSESSNLLGKSVEMLANAIAEMRTYGEGFIIADQSPGLLDMSVIRNTNTKIIMRLPDKGDRELVGRAANLNDDQITELAKLPCGVAAVYQNEWLQPVLCKVDKYVYGSNYYSFTPTDEDKSYYEGAFNASNSLLDFIMNKELVGKDSSSDIKKLKDMVLKSKLDTSVKMNFLSYINAEKELAFEVLRVLVFDFLDAKEAIQKSTECTNIQEWVRSVVRGLNPNIEKYTKEQIDLVMALLIYEQSLRDNAYENILCRFTEVYKNEGGVF